MKLDKSKSADKLTLKQEAFAMANSRAIEQPFRIA